MPYALRLSAAGFLLALFTPLTHAHVLLADTLQRLAPDADAQVLRLAASAVQCADPGAERLAVIDFSLSANDPRLWVFDLREERLLFEERVSHGRGSGNEQATQF